MKISEIMTKNVEIIAPGASLADAAKRMKALNIGCLPVSDGDRLIGMITDRDLVIRGMAEQKDCLTTQIKDSMTSPVVYCFEDQTVEEMARIMEVKQVRRIVVMGRDQSLKGIASLDNLAQRRDLAGEVLSRVTNSFGHKTAA